MVVAVPAVVVRSVVVVIHQGWRSWSLPYRQLSSCWSLLSVVIGRGRCSNQRLSSSRSSLSVVVGRSRCSNQRLSSGRSSFSVVVGRGSCSKAECEICGQGRAKAKKLSRNKCAIVIDKRSRSIVVNVGHCCQGSRSYKRPRRCHQSQRRAWSGPSHCK